MKHISFNNCDRVSHVEWPNDDPQVTLQSKATKITTDFKVHRPLIIDADTKAVEAEYLMKKGHVKLKLVLDRAQQFVGTVSYKDLNDQEIMKKVAGGDPRSDLSVSDFMKPKSTLKAIDWSLLENMSIRCLLQRLANSEEQHVLITEYHGESLRGLISGSDIVRALHLDLNLALPVSFKMISQAINKQAQFAA